jgi:hypothetical protein
LLEPGADPALHVRGGARLPSVDIIDEFFVVAPREAVRSTMCDESTWRGWFPGLALTAYDDRGLDGVRWNLTGDLVGTAEVWLEEYGDGTIVHTYIRAEPARFRRNARRVRAWARKTYALPLKGHGFAVKDRVEGAACPARTVGEPRVPLSSRSARRRTATAPPRIRRRPVSSAPSTARLPHSEAGRVTRSGPPTTTTPEAVPSSGGAVARPARG